MPTLRVSLVLCACIWKIYTQTQDNKPIDNQPRLGRLINLGDFYDARYDVPIVGESLWSPDYIEQNKVIKEAPYEKTSYH